MTQLQLAVPRTTMLTRPARTLRQDDRTQLTVRLANDKKTRQDCYKLRYLSYFSEGYIDPCRSKMFSDEYDQQPDAQTIMIYKGKQAVASTRVCALTYDLHGGFSGGIPAQHMFAAEIESMFDRDTASPAQSIIEINRLVRHPDLSEDKTLVFMLFRLAGYLILKREAMAVVSCVRRNHIPFYSRLRFSEVAGPRLYHGLKFSTHLLSCMREQYDQVRRMVPMLDVTGAGRKRYDRLHHGDSVAVFP